MLLDIEVGGTNLPDVGTGTEVVHEGRGPLTTERMRSYFRIMIYWCPCTLQGHKITFIYNPVTWQIINTADYIAVRLAFLFLTRMEKNKFI